MSILGNLGVSASLCSSSSTNSLRCFSHPSKVDFTSLVFGGTSVSDTGPKWPHAALDNNARRNPKDTGRLQASPKSITHTQEAERFLLNVVNMSLVERLNLAWKIIFPSQKAKSSSNARVAKQRLKMILFSDRCAVSDVAKQMIVSNIVRALSDFVEIESRDKVQLSVSTDLDLGTIYSVTVPVRRVKPEYQDIDESGTITNIEYKDTGEVSGSVDVRFDFYVPE